jgi:hypothetical protein
MFRVVPGIHPMSFAWLQANIELIVFRALRVLSRAYAFPPYVLGTLFPAPRPATLQCALQQSSIAQLTS